MPDRLELLIVLAAFVGLRQGELLELRRADVDGVTGRVSVSRKVDKDVIPEAAGGVAGVWSRVSAPESRERDTRQPCAAAVPVNAAATPAGAYRPGPSGLLFPGDRTDRMSVGYLMDRYRPAREKAGRPDLTIHHLRHAALTMAGQMGATAAKLQARAGHASQATMALYQHATPDRDKRLADQIGATCDARRDTRRSE